MTLLFLFQTVIVITIILMKASQFKSRQELEDHIVKKYGKETTLKKVTIDGTKEELAKLNLKHDSVVYGVKCVSDIGSKIKLENNYNRGEVKKSSINGTIINTKKR